MSVELDNGILMVPRSMLDAIGEEYDQRGRMTVEQAQVMIERWSKDLSA